MKNIHIHTFRAFQEARLLYSETADLHKRLHHRLLWPWAALRQEAACLVSIRECFFSLPLLKDDNDNIYIYSLATAPTSRRPVGRVNAWKSFLRPLRFKAFAYLLLPYPFK